MMSDCCNVQPKDDMYYDNCPKCGEHCEFIKEDGMEE